MDDKDNDDDDDTVRQGLLVSLRRKSPKRPGDHHWFSRKYLARTLIMVSLVDVVIYIMTRCDDDDDDDTCSRSF